LFSNKKIFDFKIIGKSTWIWNKFNLILRNIYNFEKNKIPYLLVEERKNLVGVLSVEAFALEGEMHFFGAE
jgi:hypothetical protein